MRRYKALLIPRRGFNGQSTTLEQYNRILGYLSEWLEEQRLTVGKMTAEHWDQFVEHRGWAYKAERVGLSATRYWLRNCRNQNPLQKLCARVFGDHPLFDVEWPEGERKPQRTLKISQRDEVIEAAGTTQNPERDTALIRLLWDCAGRKFELSELLWEHVDLEERTLNLLTKAEDLKPRQWEAKHFFPETAEALRIWQEMSSTKTVFGLSREGISSVLKRLSKIVGYPVSSHDFRRGLISYYAENGVSDTLGMLQTGIKTHAVYAQYGAGARLKALDDQIWGGDETL